MRRIFLMTLPLLALMQGCGENGGGGESAPPPAPPLHGGCRVPENPAPAERRPTLVVRLEYNNHLFHNDARTWNRKIFGEAPHELNHYFQRNSYGRFGLEPVTESEGTANDGIITVRLDRNHPDCGFGTAIHPDLKAALVKADPAIDFSRYDRNKDGAIGPDEMLIVFIVAGNEDAFSGDTGDDGIWGHQSCVSEADTPILDGVALMGCNRGGNYAVFGERHVDPSIHYDRDATIGIIAHELGHAALNLPDLYDTSNASAGIGYFGLMGSGMWGQESADDPYGNTPVSLSAWSKMNVGWIRPQIIAENGGEEKAFYATDDDRYNIVLLPAGGSECFLIENRSEHGYDAGMNVLKGYYRGGLAIWHIDQKVIDEGSALNTVNADAAHKGVDLEEAANAGLDNSPNFPGDAKNLYFAGNRTRFGPETSPDSRRYDGSESGVSVLNISPAAETMRATLINSDKEVSP